MKLKPEQLDRLAELLFATYRDKGLIVPKSSNAEIKKKIMAVIANNFAEEEAIEVEARRSVSVRVLRMGSLECKTRDQRRSPPSRRRSADRDRAITPRCQRFTTLGERHHDGRHQDVPQPGRREGAEQ